MLFKAFHGTEHVVVTIGIAAHPVVVLLETVEAHGDAFQSGLDKFVEFFWGKEHTIAHHAPLKTSFGNLGATVCQVLPHSRLAARGDDRHLRRVLMGAHVV